MSKHRTTYPSLAFPAAVDMGLENPSALNLRVLSQNLYSRLICADLPLQGHACSNKAENDKKIKDTKHLHYDKELYSHGRKTSDTIWHIIITQTALTAAADLPPRIQRYALFTDTEFQCDETPSVSCNREVVPWTERNDSPCCRPEFPLDKNA